MENCRTNLLLSRDGKETDLTRHWILSVLWLMEILPDIDRLLSLELGKFEASRTASLTVVTLIDRRCSNFWETQH